MSMINDLLGPRKEHVIEDGEGGRFVVSLRPRLFGTRTADATMVSFRRPDQRLGQGFGFQLQTLREITNLDGWRDPIAESSVWLTPAAAQNALAWIDSLERKGDQ